jgi:hypothetical protein
MCLQDVIRPLTIISPSWRRAQDFANGVQLQAGMTKVSVRDETTGVVVTSLVSSGEHKDRDTLFMALRNTL